MQTDRAHSDLVVLMKEENQAEYEAFVADVREMLSGVEVSARTVDDIPPEKSGKTRYAIRAFPLQ